MQEASIEYSLDTTHKGGISTYASSLHTYASTLHPKVEPPEAVAEKEVEVQAKTEVPEKKALHVVDIPSMTCSRHSTSEKAEATVALEAGPDGLLIAKFEDCVHTTELSNLMMCCLPLVQKKPAGVVNKKPAAADAAPPAVEPAAVEEPAAAAAPVSDYSIMHYGTKGQNVIGIRAKFALKAGKKYGPQVVSFGGKKCTLSKASMVAIGKEIVADLHAGMSRLDAKKKGMEKCGL